MNREIRLKCREEIATAAELGAERLGLTVSAYTRMALVERLAHDKILIEQPKDHAE